MASDIFSTTANAPSNAISLLFNEFIGSADT